MFASSTASWFDSTAEHVNMKSGTSRKQHRSAKKSPTARTIYPSTVRQIRHHTARLNHRRERQDNRLNRMTAFLNINVQRTRTVALINAAERGSRYLRDDQACKGTVKHSAMIGQPTIRAQCWSFSHFRCVKFADLPKWFGETSCACRQTESPTFASDLAIEISQEPQNHGRYNWLTCNQCQTLQFTECIQRPLGQAKKQTGPRNERRKAVHCQLDRRHILR